MTAATPKNLQEWIEMNMPGKVLYSVNNTDSWIPLTGPEPVKKEHMPALRALIKAAYPNIAPHDMARVAGVAQGFMGSFFTGGLKGKVFGENVPTNGSIADYSNAVQRLTKNEEALRHIKFFQQMAQQDSVSGAPGYGSDDKKVELKGKIALGARTRDAGTDFLDTTIQKKVDANVNSDFYSYIAGGDNGLYNSMYLNEKRWEKEIRFGGELQLPRSGDDQLQMTYNLPLQLRNNQPVEEELYDKFEEQTYAIFAAHDNTQDTALRDKDVEYDPIMNQYHSTYFKPEITLESDGKWPYKDPDQPMASGEMNYIGMRPTYDSFKHPMQPTRFHPIQKQWPELTQFRMANEWGAAGYMVP